MNRVYSSCSYVIAGECRCTDEQTILSKHIHFFEDFIFYAKLLYERALCYKNILA